ncbi:MAG: hypothetical protein MZV63_31860 [Marinilabiliales bacterium]|nr:hypothetical protein [Marinilabiliales bacterium]
MIHYNIRVKNSGNVTLISTAITDPNAVIVTVRPITTLMPGEQVDIAATHLVTQEDIDAGKVVSMATAAGFDLKGNTIEKNGNPVTVMAIQQHELSVTNKAAQTTFKKAGEVISYNLTVRNTGNVTLHKVAVTDPVLLLSTSEPVASMLPGELISMTATHTVTQEDLDAGVVVSEALAKAIDRNSIRTEAASGTVTVYGEQRPELTTEARASVSTYQKAGDEIRFTLVVRNTGNITMTNVSATDAKDLLDFRKSIIGLPRVKPIRLPHSTGLPTRT